MFDSINIENLNPNTELAVFSQSVGGIMNKPVTVAWLESIRKHKSERNNYRAECLWKDYVDNGKRVPMKEIAPMKVAEDKQAEAGVEKPKEENKHPYTAEEIEAERTMEGVRNMAIKMKVGPAELIQYKGNGGVRQLKDKLIKMVQ